MATRKRTVRAPQQQRAIDTRHDILQAAIKLFARRGFASTTVSVLAKEIGMSPGILYFHFPTKEDLLLAAIDEVTSAFNEKFQDLFNPEIRKLTATAQVRLFVDRAQAFLSKPPEYGIFFGMVAAESAEGSKRVAESMRAVFNTYAQILGSMVRYGQRKTGEFREDMDPVEFAHLVLGAYTGLFTHQHLFKLDPLRAEGPVLLLNSLLYQAIKKPS